MAQIFHFGGKESERGCAQCGLQLTDVGMFLNGKWLCSAICQQTYAILHPEWREQINGQGR